MTVSTMVGTAKKKKNKQKKKTKIKRTAIFFLSLQKPRKKNCEAICRVVNIIEIVYFTKKSLPLFTMYVNFKIFLLQPPVMFSTDLH